MTETPARDGGQAGPGGTFGRESAPWLCALGLAVAWVLWASPARAAIPEAERIRAALAADNATAGRGGALALPVAVIAADGGLHATGTWELDGAGSSRLALQLADGRRELHERTPAGYRVVRGGAPVARPLPLLPPAQALQARTEAEIAAALLGLGGDPDRVDLGLDRESDCWVLGGRDRGPFDANRRPSLWIDLETRRLVRIDAGSTARYRFGPPRRIGGVGFPAWVEVEAPGWPRWRIELRSPAVEAEPRRGETAPPAD